MSFKAFYRPRVKALDPQRSAKSQASRLCVEIDERVGAFLNRPIEGDWPYVWIDATYVKVRNPAVSCRLPS